MSVIGHSPLAGASGAAGGADPLYVDDVFSTFLYDGNGSTQSINNGIDISGEGGLVWVKQRNETRGHNLCDTERGATKILATNNNGAEGTYTTTITGFTSTGFSVGSDSGVNHSSGEYASWTFRKAPGFFDVVTYSGTGSVQNISHSLGSVPGMIMIHCRDGSHDWEVYHRSTGATKSLHLNQNHAQATDSTVWNNTTPTSSVFTVGTSSNVNQNGHNYVAYVFAHDEQSFGTDSDEAIIKCGSYTGNGSSTGPVIDLGFEPQFLLHKRADNADNWIMMDSMRGLTVKEAKSLQLYPNTTSSENNPSGYFNVTANGFSIHTTNSNYNANGETYIYMAIRRPHKPPTAGTDVLDIVSRTSTNPNLFSTALLYVDLAWSKRTSGTPNWLVSNRLTGQKYMALNSTNQEATGSLIHYDYNYKIDPSTMSQGSSQINYVFKRAPGVFDIVAADYPSSSAAIPHNLGVAPELIINKPRNVNIGWMVGSDYLQNTNGWNRYFELNSSSSEGGTSTVWNQAAPTATHFTLGSYPGSGYKGIFYLFATLNGVSKVGSYTGTNASIDIDCGFTAGARFVLIKRTDSTDDWYLFDSVRGINSGYTDDPYVLLNSNAAQVTNFNPISPLSSGFTVNSPAFAGNLNDNGGTYLFLAIA